MVTGCRHLATLLVFVVLANGVVGPLYAMDDAGRRMYLEGILPSGDTMTATVGGDVTVTGDQVICGSCHRRSGMGSSEGQEVVPSVTGEILYAPLRLPTSKPPLPPEIRPAYDDSSLKRAIREGIDARGRVMGPFMPRYHLDDQELDSLISYLKSMTTGAAPGVTDTEIHFATVIAGPVPAARRAAMLDVLHAFIEQKNAGTRHETQRARNAPWHKDTVFKDYRKWVLHVWDLQGPADTWDSQLDEYYSGQPVFAVLGGTSAGSWGPVHHYCESNRIPCLFPTTDLPVVDEDNFYTVYFSRGMVLQADAVADQVSKNLSAEDKVLQVYRQDDPRSREAASAFREAMDRHGLATVDIVLDDATDDSEHLWKAVDAEAATVLVAWLSGTDMQPGWQVLAPGSKTIYLSSSLYATPAEVPASFRPRVRLVRTSEIPGRLDTLLVRSTSWFRFRKIYSEAETQIQANTYFTMKIAGGALKSIHTYFSREYFLESIEHMIDNAVYTSVYPRISLAPDQRFVAKGYYMMRIADDDGRLEAVTDWIVPESGVQ